MSGAKCFLADDALYFIERSKEVISGSLVAGWWSSVHAQQLKAF
jgi:hypothetical protein